DAEPRAPVTEGGDCYTVRCQGERLEERLARREQIEAREAAERAAVMPRPPKGLDFRNYAKIYRRITEADFITLPCEPHLLHSRAGRAGPPALGLGPGQDLRVLPHPRRPVHHHRGPARRPRRRYRARAQVLKFCRARGLHLSESAGKETHMDRKDKVEGEGSYTGAKDYDKRTKKFVDSGKVEQAANDAAPKSEEEAREMEKAERIGKKHIKEEDPALRNIKKP